MIVLPCRGVHLQGAIRVVAVMAGFQAFLMRVMVVVAPPGSRLAERSRADDAGLAPKESVIETLCGLPDGLAGRGFRVFAKIPMVRLRRERLLDHESRRRRAFFARPPYRLCFCLCFCFGHLLSPALPVLVRQLRGPHLSTCPWCNSRSSMAETAALSPSSLPQSSTGRLDVSSVLARS